jgi:FtsZ-binding cell division protein ZapB
MSIFSKIKVNKALEEIDKLKLEIEELKRR